MPKIDFSISYAGEEKGIAEDLNRLLRERGAKVFFADNEESFLLGKFLEEQLKPTFGKNTKYVVPIVSEHYVSKKWTKYEYHIAKTEEKNRLNEMILPLRLDNVSLTKNEENRIYLNLRKYGLVKVADILMKKLKHDYPDSNLKEINDWVVTLGVHIEQFLESKSLPPNLPKSYPHLCDWLTQDLLNRLSKSPIESFKILEDERNGETFSIRLRFNWRPAEFALDFGDIRWWEVLEVLEFQEVYGD